MGTLSLANSSGVTVGFELRNTGLRDGLGVGDQMQPGGVDKSGVELLEETTVLDKGRLA